MTPPTPSTEPFTRPLRLWNHSVVVLSFIFAALWLLHLPLLKLPYYWDEAGYFVPAAHDIYTSGRFVPFSTLSNAHPPLVMTYLALAWKLFGFHHVVTRSAMLLVASVALLGLFRLAARVANYPVAVATVLCTALYPVFFAQSSLAQLDVMVAALTMWALVWYLPPQTNLGVGPATRRAVCIALFALAALTKETAVLIPMTLCGWEIVCWIARKSPRLAAALDLAPAGGLLSSSALLLALLPLAGWFAYHHAQTGYTFGNPEYVRYNVGTTLNTARIHGALIRRFWHVTWHMNLWVLTLLGCLALIYRPRRPLTQARASIDTSVVALFVMLIVAHVAALSLVGGAILARYLLPVLPLLVLLWVAAIWRCGRYWWLGIAVVCLGFAWRSEVNPPGSFVWEDNLAYRDFIQLHQDAARYIARHRPRARVLTLWPATNELTTPLLGYVNRPLHVFPVEDFKQTTIGQALPHRSDFDAALIFSTQLGLNFDELKDLLGGQVVFSEQKQGQWVAVLALGDP